MLIVDIAIVGLLSPNCIEKLININILRMFLHPSLSFPNQKKNIKNPNKTSRQVRKKKEFSGINSFSLILIKQIVIYEWVPATSVVNRQIDEERDGGLTL